MMLIITTIVTGALEDIVQGMLLYNVHEAL